MGQLKQALKKNGKYKGKPSLPQAAASRIQGKKSEFRKHMAISLSSLITLTTKK